MSNAVVWFEIAGPNPEQQREFYAKTFGWQIDANNPMNYGMVTAGKKEGAIGGGVCAPNEGMPNYVTIYVEVKDVDKALADVQKHGGEVVVPKTAVPGMVTFALFKDPAGNVVGLVHDKTP